MTRSEGLGIRLLGRFKVEIASPRTGQARRREHPMTVSNAFRLAIGLVCAACFLLACAGGVVGYSPVPYWDMWDGTILFLQKFRAGDWTSLFSQHNEHRIVLTRLLFMVEFGALGGTGGFLIAANYVFVALAAATFWRALIWLHAPGATRAATGIGGFALLAWLSLWTQDNNFTWAFQSQFFMAQLLPLWALLLLARSAGRADVSARYFWAGLVVGVLSAGTMANGLLALPLMVVLAAFLGTTRLWLCALIVAAAGTIALYLHDYHAPAGHGSLVHSLQSDPLGVFIYTFRYLGSPLYFLLGQQSAAASVAAIAGAVLTTASLATAVWSIRTRPRRPVILALLLFIAYIGASAFMTAGGRLLLGLDTAFASRYTTPAIMAWAALFCIHAGGLLRALEREGAGRIAAFAGVLIFSAWLLNYQAKALTPRTEELHYRAVAALALELKVHDAGYIGSVYPDMNVALAIAEAASKQNLSVFGLRDYRDLAENLGMPPGARPAATCAGHLDRLESIKEDRGFVRIHGWMFDQARSITPSRIEFLDAGGRVAGYALTGLRRPDVAESVSPKAELSGFTGYLMTPALNGQVVAAAEGCTFSGAFAAERAEILSLPAEAASVTVTAGSIAGAHDWLGRDHAQSQLAGLVVFGTFINSDADTGRISLVLEKGDRFLYRSGPTAGRQLAVRTNSDSPPLILPLSPDWSVISFPDSWFDTGRATVEISDQGTSWGEWSAVAVRPAP